MKKILEIVPIILMMTVIIVIAKNYCSTPAYVAGQIFDSFSDNRTYIFNFNEKLVYSDSKKQHTLVNHGCFMFDTENASFRVSNHLDIDNKENKNICKAGTKGEDSKYYSVERSKKYCDWKKPKLDEMDYWYNLFTGTKEEFLRHIKNVNITNEVETVCGVRCRKLSCSLDNDTFSKTEVKNTQMTVYFSDTDLRPIRVDISINGDKSNLKSLIKNYFFIDKNVNCSKYEYDMTFDLTTSNNKLDVADLSKYSSEYKRNKMHNRKMEISKAMKESEKNVKENGTEKKSTKKSKVSKKSKVKKDKKTSVYKVAPIE